MYELIEAVEVIRCNPDDCKDYEDSYRNGWCDACNTVLELLHARLTHDRPPEPEPEGPTDEALDELFTEIDQNGEPESWRVYARAVLARWGNHPGSPDSSTPQPVPVSERLPGPGDCDAEGMCWWYCAPAERWLRCGIPEPDPTSQVHTHWLPAHALPVPTSGEGEA